MKKLFIIAFILLVILSATTGFLVAVATKLALIDIFLGLTPTSPLLPATNILVLGVDDAFGHRSDTIMVLHTDPEQKEAFLISIPRDTLTVLPGRGLDKINHAYAYGGIDLARRTVENLLEIEIPYYILVSLRGVTNLIDELGGVPIHVEKRFTMLTTPAVCISISNREFRDFRASSPWNTSAIARMEGILNASRASINFCMPLPLRC